MKLSFAKLAPGIFQEILWAFGALIGAAFLANLLSLLLQTNDHLYRGLLADLPANAAFHLKMVLFVMCFLGIYLVRLAVAAVDSLLSA